MQSSPRLRLCERCWRPIPVSSVCYVDRRADPAHPFLAPLRSFRHLEADPACTGTQLAEVWLEDAG